MSKATDFYKGISDAINNAVKRVEPFRAIATNGNIGGQVQIQRLGADNPDAETYARLAGLRVSAGDEVAIINLGGQPFVLGKVQRGNETTPVFESGLTVAGTFTGAAVNATSFNSPRFDARTDTSATVPNTTTLNTWFEHGSYVHILPAGTWTVYAFSMQRVVHSAGSTVYTRTLVNGTGGTITSSNANTSGDWIASSAVAVGITGSATISCEYQNRVAGTAAVGYATMVMMAVRTA